MGSLEPRRSGEMEREWMESATLPAQQRFLFTRHLALLFGSGVPLVRSLEALAERVAAVLPDLMDLPADGAEVIVEASAHRRIPQAA